MNKKYLKKPGEVNFELKLAVDLNKMEHKWSNLVGQIQSPSFIHDYRWFSSYLDSYKNAKKNTYFLFAFQDESLIAVYPLEYIEIKQFGLKLKSWKIFWHNDMLINDFIFSSDKDHNSLRRLTDFLRCQKNLPWSLLFMQNVPESSNISQAFRKICLPLAVSFYHHDSKYFTCRQTYDESVNGLSGKFKRNNRRKLKNLKRMGEVSFELYQTNPDIETAFEHFIEIEAYSWKGEKNTAIKQVPEQLAFYQSLLEKFSATNQCIIHLLYLDEQPIAGQFSLVMGNTVYLLKIGYITKYNSVGPGGILFDETIRHFSGHQDIKSISFVTGEKWNDDWTPMVDRVYLHYVYNWNIPGLTAYLLQFSRNILRKIKNIYVNKCLLRHDS